MKRENLCKKQCCGSDLLDPDPTRSVDSRIYGKAHKNPTLSFFGIQNF